MKKFYVILMLLSITTLSMAQIGPSWWQFLAADFEESAPDRPEIMIQEGTDDIVVNAASLAELWGQVGDDFIYSVDFLGNPTVNEHSTGAEVTVSVPDQTAEDYTGSFTVISGETALYVLYKVVDDEVGAGDFAEIHFAPYADKFDPGREIHPQTNRPGGAGYQWSGAWDSVQEAYAWGWDPEADAPYGWATVIPGADYVEMAKYGSWTEVGAYKVDLTLETSGEVFPPAVTYTLNGPAQDTLGDAVGGTIPFAMQTVYEATTDGYFFLAVIPWTIMPTGQLVDYGDQISLAVKANDYDTDNFEYQSDAAGTMAIHNYGNWGGATHNDAYWAIAYYGARGTLTAGPLANEDVNVNYAKAYYTNNNLVIKDSEGNYDVSIYDLNGKVVGQFSGENQMNVSFLHAGYYVANILDNEGNRSVVKFVKSTY